MEGGAEVGDQGAEHLEERDKTAPFGTGLPFSTEMSGVTMTFLDSCHES